MTYALVDNATLTAVQRISGKVLTKSKDSTDIDIIALENFVQTILFYDQIIAIDDYIPKYRDERITEFPTIKFLDKNKFKLSEIEEIAAGKANDLKPKLHGGEFANDEFKKLIDLLQTHIICTWDISGSIYNLTLKSLSDTDQEFEKYGNIAAAIFSELTDAGETGNRTRVDVELLDRYGKPINYGYKVPGAKWGDGTSTGEASKAIKAFIASLVWLANRSIFYSLSAKYLQADTFLYPIRQAYQQSYISQSCNYGFDYPKRIVEHFSTSLSNDIVDIQKGGLATATSISLPIFSAWLANQTGDPSQIINAAYSIREGSEFVEAREQLKEIRRLFDETDIAVANKAVHKILEDLNKASNSIRVKYGIKTRQGIPVTKLVHVYNTIAALSILPKVPNYNFSVKIPEFFYNFTNPKGFRSLYRNLANDLSTVWSLGEARDLLGCRIQLDTEARTYNPKQEQPKYRNAHSEFKSPM